MEENERLKREVAVAREEARVLYELQNRTEQVNRRQAEEIIRLQGLIAANSRGDGDGNGDASSPGACDATGSECRVGAEGDWGALLGGAVSVGKGFEADKCSTNTRRNVDTGALHINEGVGGLRVDVGLNVNIAGADIANGKEAMSSAALIATITRSPTDETIWQLRVEVDRLKSELQVSAAFFFCLCYHLCPQT